MKCDQEKERKKEVGGENEMGHPEIAGICVYSDTYVVNQLDTSNLL